MSTVESGQIPVALVVHALNLVNLRLLRLLVEGAVAEISVLMILLLAEERAFRVDRGVSPALENHVTLTRVGLLHEKLHVRLAKGK